MVTLSTNLADLPLQTFRQLSQCINRDELWIKIVDDDEKTIYSLSPDEVEKLLRHQDTGSAVLRIFGNRGQTVFDFLNRLQKLSRVYANGNIFDQPQLILNRKFKELRWGREEQVIVSIDGNILRLACKAVGFPSPEVKWYNSNDVSTPIEEGSTLELIKCRCSAQNTYMCLVQNEVPSGYPFSAFYRKPPKKYKSVLESRQIDVVPFIRDDELCESCRSQEINRLKEICEGIDNDEEISPVPNNLPSFDKESLFASDKVAMLISNCSYEHLPELVTPHCDAQTLAEALQLMQFKTITLSDLTLDEMRFFIREYRKLLGNGVYAVIYFVGHGFEVNGQCYLLGIDAPEEAHNPQCSLSMDWVLSIFRDISPSLNLILLDVCRKFIPSSCVPTFVNYAEQFKRYHRAHRNLVYGFSTSGGVGAYEVRGEINGVFMKYLKNHVNLKCSVIDMLNKVLNDIGNDERVCDVQVPEIRSTLTHPRSLTDQLICNGHTVSFHNHTVQWQYLHELPTPVVTRFDELNICVTVLFGFCGSFSNKVYIYSCVSEYTIVNGEEEEDGKSDKALNHRALLHFPKEIHKSAGQECYDCDEGYSMRYLLSGLQKVQGDGKFLCNVELRNINNVEKVISKQDVLVGPVLLTKMREANGPLKYSY